MYDGHAEEELHLDRRPEFIIEDGPDAGRCVLTATKTYFQSTLSLPSKPTVTSKFVREGGEKSNRVHLDWGFS